MPPRGRTSSRSRNRSTSRANRGAASRRARSAARARSRAAAARRRDAARPSVRRSRAASTARSSRSGARTGSGASTAAARRRDAARPSVRRSRAASAAAARRDAARPSVRRSRAAASAAARRRDAARPSVVRARNAARQRTALSRSAGERGRGAPTKAQAAVRNRMIRANQTPARTSTASLSERRNAASAKLARQRLQTLAADRRRRQRQATGQANQRAGMYRNISSGRGRSNKTSPSTAAANQQAAQSLLSAGYRNLAGDKNRSTLGQQFMSGIRNLMRGETLSGTAVPPRRKSSCPTPDMRILMADGSLKVAGDLQVGDTVRAAHEDTLEWGDHKVTHKEIVEDEIVSLKFENSSIKCSPTHKVYLSNDSKWVEVQDLKEGDVVKTQDGDDTFISLEKIDSGDVVVLTVEDAHTYVAEGILSHNKSPRRKGGGEDDSFTDDSFTDEIIEDEVIEEELPILPVRPQFPGMGGGLGGFGYSPALMAYESQQGAGQVPYYMAAARNAMTPNMSPAFMHASRNYDILGGMQRTRARPIEMMSARERAEIMNMGSNFNVPNYNSPYPQSPGQSQFDYFRNMVSSGGESEPTFRDVSIGPGKGAARPMSQDQARAMGSGLGSLMRSGMMGMF